MLLGDEEKEQMRRLIRRVEGFTGVHVLTYAVMSNHIHLLLEVPERITSDSLSEKELDKRLLCLYSEEEVEEIRIRWNEWEKEGLTASVKADKDRYFVRMNDISEFMKQVKQRFSCWYNRKHNRSGTLWDHRFKSVLVEGGCALRTMAAYIEMNPVRAGVVNDPKSYRFCGLGEAMGGVKAAMHGIEKLASGVEPLDSEMRSRERAGTWEKASTTYWEQVLMYSEVQNDPGIAMLDREMLPDKLRRRMKLSQFERLQCRSRFFSDGQVFGSQEFIEEFFANNRDYFGPNRKTGARKVRGGWDGIYTIRDLGNWCGT